MERNLPLLQYRLSIKTEMPNQPVALRHARKDWAKRVNRAPRWLIKRNRNEKAKHR
jgi:hypothetical protein